jgi:hypothetical protein
LTQTNATRSKGLSNSRGPKLAGFIPAEQVFAETGGCGFLSHSNRQGLAPDGRVLMRDSEL